MAKFIHPNAVDGEVWTEHGVFPVSDGLAECPENVGRMLGWTPAAEKPAPAVKPPKPVVPKPVASPKPNVPEVPAAASGEADVPIPGLTE